MALMESEELNNDLLPYDIGKTSPDILRDIFRTDAYQGTTAGMSDGYTQGNLAVMPESYALDFSRFCQRNPKSCPIVGVSDTGNPLMFTLGQNIDIRTDIPSYNVYRDGSLDSTIPNIRDLWSTDSVAFVIGCSFSFEEALLQGGVPLRHQELGRIVPMYETNINNIKSGPFGGSMVVSMRPMSVADSIRASAITARFPHTHGMPVHIGASEEIGIKDISQPDWGEPTEFCDNEVPVFWACGVTPQNAIREAGIPLVFTHTPGSMLITDCRSSEV